MNRLNHKSLVCINDQQSLCDSPALLTVGTKQSNCFIFNIYNDVCARNFAYVAYSAFSPPHCSLQKFSILYFELKMHFLWRFYVWKPHKTKAPMVDWTVLHFTVFGKHRSITVLRTFDNTKASKRTLCDAWLSRTDILNRRAILRYGSYITFGYEHRVQNCWALWQEKLVSGRFQFYQFRLLYHYSYVKCLFWNGQRNWKASSISLIENI